MMLKKLLGLETVSNEERMKYKMIIQSKIDLINSSRGRLLLILTVILELFLIVFFDIRTIIDFGISHNNVLLYLIAHLVILFNAFFGIYLGNLLLKEKHNRISEIVKPETSMKVILSVFLVSIAFINGLDQTVNNSISMFVFFLLMASFFAVIKPRYFIVISFVSYMVFVITMYYFQADSKIFINNVFNLLFMTLTTIIIAFTSYNHLFHYLYSNIKLEEMKSKLEVLSSTDDLTGVYNRRKLDEEITKEIARARRTDGTFSLMMIDIDYFKTINDLYGHLVGDEVLIKMAKFLQGEIRLEDTIGRFGGEEFIIVLTNTNVAMASNKAEYLRNEIESMSFSEKARITVSIGVTEFKSEDDIFTIINRSDKFLYEAKEQGRNSVYSELLGKLR